MRHCVQLCCASWLLYGLAAGCSLRDLSDLDSGSGGSSGSGGNGARGGSSHDTLTLQPYEQPGAYLSRVENTARVVGEDSPEGHWRLVSGLADPGCSSFEISTAREVYLRHSEHLLWTARSDRASGFPEDATFCLRDGLAATGAELRSLESVNFPGYFVTQPGDGQAALEELVDSDDFRARATWIMSAD
jgi:hypothetical protein